MKLTLSARTDVIRLAKRLAKRHRTSVSAMFERMVRVMANSETKPLGPLTRKASGIITLPVDKSDRTILEEALSEKYEANP